MTGPEDSEDPRGVDTARVAEYALGLLSPAEAEEVRRAVAADPDLQRELRFWHERFAGLDGEFAEATPPAGGYAALERRLFGKTRSGLWQSLGFWRALTGLATAVALVAIGANVLAPARPDPDAFATQLVAALEAEGAGVRFLALYDRDRDVVRLIATDIQPVPDRDYELWAIAGEAPPVSMGVVEAGAHNQVPLTTLVSDFFGEGTVLAITLEPPGGSPTGVATGPIVAAGPVSAI